MINDGSIFRILSVDAVRLFKEGKLKLPDERDKAITKCDMSGRNTKIRVDRLGFITSAPATKTGAKFVAPAVIHETPVNIIRSNFQKSI